MIYMWHKFILWSLEYPASAQFFDIILILMIIGMIFWVFKND